MKVIFAGGGTGGHLYPSISVAEKLQKNNIEFYFMVSDRGIEADILSKLGYPYEEQKVSAFMGKGIAGKIKAVINMIKATFRALKVIEKGDKIFLTGGFAAAPSALAGKLKSCDLYMHEQNSVMGLVNRLFAKFSKKVFLSFEDTKNININSDKFMVTGNPVREIFTKLPKKKDYTGNVLVIGGSQGSRKINKLIVSSIDLLMDEGFNLIHQTGKKLYDETVELYGEGIEKYKGRLEVTGYIDNSAEAMSKADIIITRSGSGAVFEITVLECPAVYIPFAQASENHQYYNAVSIEKQGGCIIIEEKDADKESLMNALKDIKENIGKYRENLSRAKKYNSSEIIYKEIMS